MKISKMIEELEFIKKNWGDLPICGGYLSDDTPPKELCVLNKDGCNIMDEAGEAVEVFIS